MALPDLTGQHIEDTYPRLLHIDSGSKLIYNGIGSLVDVFNATASFAVTASYAISASYEIVKEVSSSYAETASLVIGKGSGSFSGSFFGDGSGLTGLISSSYAESSSYTTTAFTTLNTPFAVITASNSNNDDTIEFLKGGGATFAVTVNNVQDAVSSSYALTASYVNPLVQNVIITGSIDVLNGHVNLNSNSYFLQGTSTVGSNVELIGVTAQDTIRIGNQGYDNIIVDDTTISGSLTVTGTCKSSLFLNRQLLTQDQTVPSTDNGMLTGPISISESINLIVESPSTLVIL